MDIRAEFEDWYTKAFGYPFNLTIRDGKYMNSDANSMWIAWQAATEELRSNKKPIAWAKIDEPTGDVLSLGIEALRRFDTPKDTVPLYLHPPAPVVPECCAQVLKMPEISHYSEWGQGYKEGWNNCREALIKAVSENAQ